MLDQEQFAPLDERQTRRVRALSEISNAHVIAHRIRDPDGLPLWAAAGPAYYLDEIGLDLLRQAERELGHGIALVAYAHPLELRLPAHVLAQAAQGYRRAQRGQRR